MTAKEKAELRRMVADLLSAAGCSCCRSEERWDEAKAELANRLGVPPYDDGSGFNFHQFATPRPRR